MPGIPATRLLSSGVMLPAEHRRGDWLGLAEGQGKEEEEAHHLGGIIPGGGSSGKASACLFGSDALSHGRSSARIHPVGAVAKW